VRFGPPTNQFLFYQGVDHVALRQSRCQLFFGCGLNFFPFFLCGFFFHPPQPAPHSRKDIPIFATETQGPMPPTQTRLQFSNHRSCIFFSPFRLTKSGFPNPPTPPLAKARPRIPVPFSGLGVRLLDPQFGFFGSGSKSLLFFRVLTVPPCPVPHNFQPQVPGSFLTRVQKTNPRSTSSCLSFFFSPAYFYI